MLSVTDRKYGTAQYINLCLQQTLHRVQYSTIQYMLSEADRTHGTVQYMLSVTGRTYSTVQYILPVTDRTYGTVQ